MADEATRRFRKPRPVPTGITLRNAACDNEILMGVWARAGFGMRIILGFVSKWESFACEFGIGISNMVVRRSHATGSYFLSLPGAEAPGYFRARLWRLG
jgi:hypothetical protein